MPLLRETALRIPRIRRLYNANKTLVNETQRLQARLHACETSAGSTGSPFYHYNACFDPQEVIRRHAAPDLRPHPDYLTNFLGVRISPKFYPPLLAERGGEIEAIPIPANWHADIAEWGAALRAVDLARNSFTMIELGCGWGCWMNNTGVAARRLGLDTRLIGVEGDEGHIAFAREACESNGFQPSQISLHRGIAAAREGVALFPRQEQAGGNWGLEPIFNADQRQYEAALQSGKYEALPLISLTDVIETNDRIDLLHVDIQGGEADLIRDCLPVLDAKIAYVLIGTHSRQIEGRLFDTFLEAGWRLEIERPAILSIGEAPIVTVDGVQAWRNPKLLPLAA